METDKLQELIAKMDSIKEGDQTAYTPDEIINIISDTLAEADSEFIAKIGTMVLAGKVYVASSGYLIWKPNGEE